MRLTQPRHCSSPIICTEQQSRIPNQKVTTKLIRRSGQSLTNPQYTCHSKLRQQITTSTDNSTMDSATKVVSVNTSKSQIASVSMYFQKQDKIKKGTLKCVLYKLGIRPKNRLIRGVQSHRPLAGASFKVRAHRNCHQGESNLRP